MKSLQLESLLLIFAGWANRHQQDVIDYLREENRALRGQLGGSRLLFTDQQRRRLALVRYFVLFVINLKTRRVEISGIVPQPDREWMKQIARNLTDIDDGFLNGARDLIHDRDPLFTKSFLEMLKSSGVKTVKLPARSPNLNAYAERFVRFIKSKCLSQIIPLGKRHLRQAVKEFTEHYHVERNHQGLDNELIDDQRSAGRMGGNFECHERLGGVLNYYYRRAA